MKAKMEMPTSVLTRSFATHVVASLCQAEVVASGETLEWLRLHDVERGIMSLFLIAKRIFMR